MKQFTFSDMNRAAGEILETALIEPVALTKRGKQKLAILTAEAYDRLQGRPQAQSYRLEDAPDDIHDALMEGIDAILDGPHRDA